MPNKYAKLNRLKEKVVSIPFFIWFTSLITGYLLGTLGWVVIFKGDVTRVWQGNIWSTSLSSTLLVTILFILLILIFSKENNEKQLNKRLKLVSLISLAALTIPLLPFSIPRDNFFYFIRLFQEQAWGWQVGVFVWMVSFFAGVVYLGRHNTQNKERGIFSLIFEGDRPFWLLLGLFIGIYIVHGFYLFDNLILNAYDFGIYDHTVWRLAYKLSPANSVNGFGNSFGAHFQPLVAVLAPFYWIWNSPKMLIVLEVLIVAVGAIPVYKITKRRFNNRLLSLAMVFAYLFFIGNGAALAFPFHPSTMLA
ncbi:MAG: DUF2079 domain-containing protein, partial [Candidatus Pacebacteria bacterium]|nr:DUF2079 domain-containing protein [Candidatus Paceibacterota bacterium]